jgi:hypothetical protein
MTADRIRGRRRVEGDPARVPPGVLITPRDLLRMLRQLRSLLRRHD